MAQGTRRRGAGRRAPHQGDAPRRVRRYEPHMRTVTLAALLLASAAAPPAARAAAWFADAETGIAWAGRNEVRIPDEGGTRFSLVDDLSASPAPYARFRLGVTLGERHTILGLYAPLRLTSRGPLPRDVTFAGTTFPAGSDVLATYRFDSIRLGYRYGVVRTARWQVDAGAAAKVRDAGITVQGATRAARSNTGLVPLLSFRVACRVTPALAIVLDGDALGAPQGRAEDVGLAAQATLRDGVEARVTYRVLEGGSGGSGGVYNFALVHFAGAGLTVAL